MAAAEVVLGVDIDSIRQQCAQDPVICYDLLNGAVGGLGRSATATELEVFLGAIASLSLEVTARLPAESVPAYAGLMTTLAALADRVGLPSAAYTQIAQSYAAGSSPGLIATAQDASNF